MKTQLNVEQYSPTTEYCEGRIFFGKKGQISTLKFSAYIEPVMNLLKEMKIKHINWKVQGQIVPERLIPYIKPPKEKGDSWGSPSRVRETDIE